MGGSSLQPLRAPASLPLFFFYPLRRRPSFAAAFVAFVSPASDFLQFFVSRASITSGKYCQEKSDSSSLLHRPKSREMVVEAKNYVKFERKSHRLYFCCAIRLLNGLVMFVHLVFWVLSLKCSQISHVVSFN